MKFLVFDENWIVDGSILYDSPIDPIEAATIQDLAKIIPEMDEMKKFEVNYIEGVDENELIVEFLMPFALTHQYHFIEEEEAKKRRLNDELSEPE